MKGQLNSLEWVPTIWGLEPRWRIEPDVDALRQTLLSLHPSSTVDVASIGQGGFNKIFDVQIDGETFILRVSLPLDPCYKTLSEVATMKWLHHITAIPIATPITYRTINESLVGFEWILTSKLPGRPFDEFKSVPLAAKAYLVKQLAAFSASLFQHQLRGIGNIYTASTEENVTPEVERIVSLHFIWGDRVHQDINRGPFRTTQDWMQTRLSLNEHECRLTMNKCASKENPDSDDEDDLDDATRTLDIIGKLKPLVDLIFPPDDTQYEQTMLFHDILLRSNILCNEDGEVTGILDWECVSAVPLWKACDYPYFLIDRPRLEEPNVDTYQRKDDGQPCELYWEHLWEYEATQLRGVFLDEMKRLEPDWVDIFTRNQIQRSLDLAVQTCDNAFMARVILAWVADFTAGESNIQSLRDRMYK